MKQPRLGKLSGSELEQLILGRLGAKRSEVLVGPGTGLDCAIVRLGAGRVLAVTADPLSFIPVLGPALSARLSCHLLASDLWTSGIPPAYVSVVLDLPPGLVQSELDVFAREMGAEWERLGVAVIAGHTGRYPGSGGTVVGGETLFGVGDEGRYLTPAMASPGDRVIVTKGCAVETTAVAAYLVPDAIEARLEAEGLARARTWVDRVSVVRDCLALLRLGVRERGVTGLHDATEGGVLGGLLELARACGHDLRVLRARIPLLPEARAACEALGIDPYWSLSEGTLIATVRPEKTREALEALEAEGIPAAEVGEVMPGSGALWLTEPDGRVVTLKEPLADPYWDAYRKAVQRKGGAPSP